MTSIASSLANSTANQVKITNLLVPLANTEVPHVLEDGVKFIEIFSRNGRCQYAFEPTESGTKYRTIPKNVCGYLAGMSFNGKTLYIQSSVSTTIEILELF